MLSSIPVLLGVRLRGSCKASEVGGSDTSNEVSVTENRPTLDPS
jgi:hypothetical protein